MAQQQANAYAREQEPSGDAGRENGVYQRPPHLEGFGAGALQMRYHTNRFSFTEDGSHQLTSQITEEKEQKKCTFVNDVRPTEEVRTTGVYGDNGERA